MTAKLTRARDWRARLSTLIEQRRRVPYTEEVNCALFMADAVLAMTGQDLAAPFRGKFKTLAEGDALLKASGFADLPSYLAAQFEEINPVLARVGDLMLFEVEQGWGGGVVNGERVTVLSLNGLGTVRRSQGKRAFRVG
jgi:hypothetical protein